MVGLLLISTLLLQAPGDPSRTSPPTRYLELFARLHNRPVADSTYLQWWHWLYPRYPRYRSWLLALRLEKEIGLGHQDSARIYLRKLLTAAPPRSPIQEVIRSFFYAFGQTLPPETLFTLLDLAQPYGFQDREDEILWWKAQALRRRSPPQADSLLRLLATTYPSSPYADRIVSEISGLDSITVGRIAFAHGRYEDALRLLPPDDYPKEHLLSLYFLRKDREFLKAEARLRPLLPPATRARLTFLRALTLERLDRYSEAIRTLVSLVKTGGSWGERAAYELSHLALQKRWVYRILKALKPVAPGHPAAVSRVALLYLAMDQRADAWQWFQKNLHSSDDFYRAQALYFLYKLTGNTQYRDTLIHRYPLSYYTAILPDSFAFPPSRISEDTCALSPAFRLYAKLHEYAWALAVVDSEPACALQAAKIAVEVGAPYLATRLVWRTLASPPVWDSLRLTLLFPYPDPWARKLRDMPVPAFLLMAIMREESHFHPWVISRAGAIGLTQLMPRTYQAVTGEPHPLGVFHPFQNLRVGARYLAQLLERFGDPRLAVAAYNAGPGAVTRWLQRWQKAARTQDLTVFVEFIPYRETRNYVRRVMRSYRMYQRLYRHSRASSGDLEGTP